MYIPVTFFRLRRSIIIKIVNNSAKDYYEILGISTSASQQEIKEAYRKQAFQYHPDRNKDDPSASDKMKALNEAYATLSDPRKRKEYDLLKERYGSFAYKRYRQTHSQEDIFRGSDIDQVFQEFASSFGFRNADEIFREFYGPGFHGYVYRRPGFTYRRNVYGSPGNSAGAQTPVPAFELGFGGKILKFFLEKILRIQIPERGKDLVDVLKIRPELALTGGEVEYDYRKWGRANNLIVKVPPGIKNGQKIRLRRMGSPGKAGGEPGDLLLKVRIKISLLDKIKAVLKGS